MLARVAVVLVFLVSSTGALVPLLNQTSGSATDSTQGEPITQAIWLAVYGLTLVLITMRWQRFARVFTGDKLLLLLVGLALISVLWSAAPEVTLRRGVALMGTTLLGGYLVTRFSLDELLRLLAWALGIVALFSLLFALALPSYGVSSDPLTPGDWQGVFGHKNTLGKNMALGAIVFFLLARSRRRHRWIMWAGFGLSVVLVLLSQSSTALVVLVGCLILIPVCATVLRWRYTLAIPLAIASTLVGGGVALWLLSNVETVLGGLGKDLTLTGRTQLWAAVVDMVWERPWLGYGYSAFWRGWEGDSASLWLITGQEYYDAHNGFLDLWLDLGLAGLSVFVLGLLLAFLRAIFYLRGTATADGLWPVVFLTFMALYNVTESSTLQQNSLFWMMYVITLLQVAGGRRQFVAAPGAETAVQRQDTRTPKQLA